MKEKPHGLIGDEFVCELSRSYKRAWALEKNKTPFVTETIKPDTCSKPYRESSVFPKMLLILTGLQNSSCRFSFRELYGTPIDAIAVENFTDWTHIAILKLFIVPSSVLDSYVSEMEARDIYKSMRLIYTEAIGISEIHHPENAGSDFRAHLEGNIYLSAGCLLFRRDVLKNKLVSGKPHMMDYLYPSTTNKVPVSKARIMNSFYTRVASKILG